MSKTIDFGSTKWSDWVNEKFVPLMTNEDQIIICYGGRGSSKSYWAATKLVFRCLYEPYFRYILIRNQFNTIKDSQYQLIKDVVDKWGLNEYFKFTINPLRIECVNGNFFMCKGLDKPENIKSISDPTGIWWEEDIPDENDFITVSGSIRTTKAKYIQQIFTINPEVPEPDYKDNWFHKRFFGEHTEKSFRDVKIIKIGDTDVELTYTVHHSTYKDNRWLSIVKAAEYENYLYTNPYKYIVHTLGEWGNTLKDGLFYKNFDRIKHINQLDYNPDIPLHISFDFNVKPYLSILISQLVDKQIYVIDEITGIDPYNNTKDSCKLFLNKYGSHGAGLFVYGDPSGKNNSTRSEMGYNDYKIIEQELKQLRPTFRIATKHPPVKKRGEFINDIFRNEWNGMKITINNMCVSMIADFINVKESPDGSKLKEKKNGVETYAHLSDCLDYMMCEAYKNEFKLYQYGAVTSESVWVSHTPSPKHRL